MSRFIMIASSVLLAVYGVILLFFPEALLAGINLSVEPPVVLQLIAPGVLGFAMMNWIGRAAIYGGSYQRPILVGNFTHAGMLTILLAALQIRNPSLIGWMLTAAFLCYWVGFVRLLYWPPWDNEGPRRDQAS